MLIKVPEQAKSKVGLNLYAFETFYPCDGKKECCNTKECGTKCKFTKDKDHWIRGTKPIRTMALPYS